MSAELEIQLIAALAAGACAIPGVFLVLRRMSLMSDAISHAVLPGIVIMYFLVGGLKSPLLIVGAVLMGVVTVTLTEVLERTKLVREDAAIGTVFPVLFSIGVILVSKFAGNVHLDVDAVLHGELVMATFDRFVIAGVDLGSISFVVMLVIFLANLILLLVYYKELKLATFDPGLAAALGFSPILIHYGLMLMTSVTVVGAFNSVGSILVVALIIAPPATAYMLTDRLWLMTLISVFLGAACGVVGFQLSLAMNTSIAGTIAGVTGVCFLFAVLFAPERGIIVGFGRYRRQKLDFGVQMLLVHLFHHEGSASEQEENRTEHLSRHVSWEKEFAHRIVGRAKRRKLINESSGLLVLTDQGRDEAVKTMEIYY